MNEARTILDVCGILFILLFTFFAWDQHRRREYIEKCKFKQHIENLKRMDDKLNSPSTTTKGE